jgi:hypothetical protein
LSQLQVIRASVGANIKLMVVHIIYFATIQDAQT